jgi:hypothetical protein
MRRIKSKVFFIAVWFYLLKVVNLEQKKDESFTTMGKFNKIMINANDIGIFH